MCRNVERVEYRRGMLESGGRPDVLPVKTWTGAELPEDARSSIRE